MAQGVGQDALTLAYSALVAGRLEEAELLYSQALQSRSEEVDALLGLAYIAHRTDRQEEALTYYQRVLRQDPNQASAHAGLLALSREFDLTPTGSRAQEMAQRHPESAAALSALGSILVRQDRLADATVAFSRAQALEPNNATHAYNLAVALDRQHQYGQAQSHYERALALASVSADATASGFSRAVTRQRLEQLRQASEPAP